MEIVPGERIGEDSLAGRAMQKRDNAGGALVRAL